VTRRRRPRKRAIRNSPAPSSSTVEEIRGADDTDADDGLASPNQKTPLFSLEVQGILLHTQFRTTTQGDTVEEAIQNLREATELYPEEFPQLTTGRPLLTSFEISARA